MGVDRPPSASMSLVFGRQSSVSGKRDSSPSASQSPPFQPFQTKEGVPGCHDVLFSSSAEPLCFTTPEKKFESNPSNLSLSRLSREHSLRAKMTNGELKSNRDVLKKQSWQQAAAEDGVGSERESAKPQVSTRPDQTIITSDDLMSHEQLVSFSDHSLTGRNHRPTFSPDSSQSCDVCLSPQTENSSGRGTKTGSSKFDHETIQKAALKRHASLMVPLVPPGGFFYATLPEITEEIEFPDMPLGKKQIEEFSSGANAKEGPTSQHRLYPSDAINRDSLRAGPQSGQVNQGGSTKAAVRRSSTMSKLV